MGYFNFDDDENDRRYYEKGNISDPNNLLNSKNWIIFVGALLLWVIFHFFGYKESITCDQTSCELYKIRRLTNASQPYKKFYESDIQRFGYTRFNSEDRTTYTPYVVLNDGSRIKLKMLETNNMLEVKYLSFDTIRNKKFSE